MTRLGCGDPTIIDERCTNLESPHANAEMFLHIALGRISIPHRLHVLRPAPHRSILRIAHDPLHEARLRSIVDR